MIIMFFNFSLTSYSYSSTTSIICFFYTRISKNYTTSWKIWTLYIFHKT